MQKTRASLIEDFKLQQELEQRRILKQCIESPWYWLTNFTKTFDEHAQIKKVEVHKPFPDKSYLQAMLEIFMSEEDRIFCAKSREMMLSWLVAGFITWQCQFFPRTRWVVQSKDEDTASELLSYCKCLYGQQPEWMRRKYPLQGGRIETDGGLQSKLLHLWQHESRVKGVPSGADKVRQAHPTGVFFDEACFIDEFEAAYASAGQVTPKVIAISSAVPGGYFAQVCGAA